MRYSSRPSEGLSTASKVLALVVGIGAIGAIGYFMIQEKVLPQMPKLHELPVVQPSQAQASSTATLAVKPEYQEPVAVPQVEPLPELNQSDASVLAALKALNINGLVEMILPEEIIRKFVRAVVSLEDGKIVTDYSPIQSPQGAFVTDVYTVKISGGDVGEQQDVEQYRISPKNYLRYTLFVQVIAAIDSDAAYGVYKRFYPLLNAAYKEMGLQGNFHSVLVRAIDKTLAAPEINGDMTLIHPKVFYQFADPALETMPSTYKLLFRMGEDNAAKVKTSLQHIRKRLVTR